jgi:indolepyruvate decarboxylase
MPVVGTPIKGQPLAGLTRHASAPAEREGALAAVLERLKHAKRPVLLPSAAVSRFGLLAKVTALLDRSRIPFALAPMDKGILDETHPGYLGVYAGVASAPAAVRQAVEEADLVLDLGGLVFEDLNTGYWSDRLGDDRLITFGADFVRVGDKLFTAATLSDMVDGLLTGAPVFDAPTLPEKKFLDLQGAAGDKIGSASFYPRLQRMLRAGDVLVAETGTASANLAKLLLPRGVSCESQTLWGAIGWATPATLGIAMADLSRRAVLVTGDGAHQLTANDIGVMGRYGIKPVIFVLNNGIYGIEDVLSERGHVYDDIAPWNYHTVPAAMGCKGWFAARVATVAELEQAIATAQTHDGACYIEVLIPEAESQPLPKAMIDQIYKTDVPR